jgi:hypothetical protein
MLIAIVNHSTRVSDADVNTMTAACQVQMNNDICKVWGGNATLTFYADKTAVPTSAWLVSIIDNPDVADALGYHTVEGSEIDAFVFCEPVLDNGGVVLGDASNANTISVASVLSHECGEMFVDPQCNTFVRGPMRPEGNWYSKEIADPVQDSGYFVNVNGANVSVSDFVLPSFFDPKGMGPFDHLGKLNGPFSMTQGGYMVLADSQGNQQQIFGMTMPDWQKALKQGKFSRSARRA